MPISKPLRFCTHSLALACTALLLVACQTTQAPASTAVTQQTGAQASLANRAVLRQDAFSGVYEIAAAADGDVVYVADITGFDGNNAGFVHRLDARTLQTLQTTQVPRRSFALGLNNATQTLYAGNTMEGSLSVVDLATGMLKAQIQLADPTTNDKGETAYAHTRKVIVDEAHNRVFVTSPGRPGLVWIVDGATNTLQHTITSDGIWSAGAAYDAKANRLYVGQGGQNEVLVIDPDTGSVVQRLSTGEMTPEHKDRSANFFINIALDANKQRLFAAGGQKNQVYVWDLASGKVVDRIPFETGTLDIVFNSARNEIVTSHRGDDKAGSGFVTILDADSYAVKRRLDLPVHPNSLALSPNGQTLYVTVKAPHGDQHPAYRKDAKDSVVRLDLNQP